MKYQISPTDINQWETGIGDKKLLVELYVMFIFWRFSKISSIVEQEQVDSPWNN